MIMEEADDEEFALEKNDKAGRPGVINREMLTRLAIEQGTKSAEAGKLFVQDGIDLTEIRRIRIEFSNILKIDNLWIMASNLTRLRLSNNRIDKIENLDSLVRLTELDLSFNRIRVIENLDNLVNLEHLLLCANEIREIGAIEKLTNITILSVGANRIDSWDHIIYLRQFRKLRILNVSGNGCTLKDGYSDYLVGFLSRIVYLNYRMIGETERRAAREKHRRAIENLEENEAAVTAEIEEKKAEEERQAVLSLSYVEYLDGDGLFRRMYEHDEEGRELARINDEARIAHEEYKNKFGELCGELYELGLAQREKRAEEMRMFENIVNEGREAVHTEARGMMDEIVARKLRIFEEIGRLLGNRGRRDEPVVSRRADDSSDIEDDLQEQIAEARRLSNEFNDLLGKTWSRLMHKEVILHEQIEDTNESHKLNMGDLITGFTESARGIFAQLRDAEADYNDNIEAIATIYANAFTDQQKMPPSHFVICGDKDILGNTLVASHDLHSQIVDAREDLMMARITNWYESYTEQLARDETERNRKQVLEISHFLEHQREEFDALRSQLRSGSENPLDADIAAALEAR